MSRPLYALDELLAQCDASVDLAQIGVQVGVPGIKESPCQDAIFDVYIHQIMNHGASMRTTVTLDDTLYQQALEMADPTMDKADIFREAFKTFVRVQAAKRLASLGGAVPDMQEIPRRHADIATP